MTGQPPAGTRSPNSTVATRPDIAHVLGGLIHGLAHLLHLSPAVVVVVLVVVLLLLSCVVAICCVRCRNKRKGSIRNLPQVHHFDDLPLPDFLDEGQGAGHFYYSLQYDMKQGALMVLLSNAENIPAADNESCDCYVTVALVQPAAGTSKWSKISATKRSPTVENSVNPVFNHDVSIKAPLDVVLSSWLLFEFYLYDAVGEDRKIGRLVMRIPEIDSNAFVGPVLELDDCIVATDDQDEAGNVCLVMRLVSMEKTASIEIIVLEARYLKINEKAIKPRARIKVGLAAYVDGKKRKNYVSRPQPVLSRNPYFSAEFRVALPEEDLRQAEVKVSIFYLHPPLMLRDRIGVVRLGPRVDSAVGRLHWNDIFKHPMRQIARWHAVSCHRSPWRH